MTEFGHITIKIGNTHIDSWGAGPFVIVVGDKSFRFEDSDRFGPSTVTKSGNICATQPGERSPFWRAHMAWRKQGRRLEPDGVTCIYEALRPTKVKLLRNGDAVVVEHGDDDGGFEFVGKVFP